MRPIGRGISALVLVSALLCTVGMAQEHSEQHANTSEWLRNQAESGTSEGRVILLDQAIQGYAEAQFMLGDMYRGGVGATRDMAQARHWYQAAAAQGHSMALESLRILASDGDSAAFYILGVLSRDGRGVPRDLVAARQAFHWASEGGHILAHFAEAELMANGMGGAVDELAALRSYLQTVRLASAALGSPVAENISATLDQSRALAQYWMGRTYLTGHGGVVQNAAAAAGLFESAARDGVAQAQYELGRLFARGRGVPHDPMKATAWFEKAVAQGLRAADEEIAGIKSELK